MILARKCWGLGMLTDAPTGGQYRMFTFLPVFKGEKLTSYTFQLDSKHLSIQVKDSGLYGLGSTGGKTSGSRRERFQRLLLLVPPTPTKTCLIQFYLMYKDRISATVFRKYAIEKSAIGVFRINLSVDEFKSSWP